MGTSKVDLVVIHPGASHGIYGPLGDTLVAVEPPLWTRLIAGYVLDRGFTVEIIDAEADQQGPHEVGQLVRDMNPRLVCLAVYGHQPSASTQQMTGAGAIARAIKSQTAVPVIMVGGHVSALPERTMREEAIDFACVGEGPVTVAGLLTGGDHWEHVPGLVWRFPDGTVRINASAPLLHPADLHGNVWHMLPMHRYRAHNWHAFGDPNGRVPYASIYTTLGCPYRCSFCCINAPFGEGHNGNLRSYRMRDPGTVVAEINSLYRDYGVRTFKITDEMFVLNERHYTAICEGLIARGIAKDLNIWAYARVDTVKQRTLSLFHRAGIRWLALGIESASAFVRDGADKRFKNDDIKGVVRAIQAADINVIGNYIFGLPDDTAESMQDTLALAQDLNTEFANFYSAMAYPGSPLYDEAVAKGWTLPATWRGYSQHNDDCRPLDTSHVSGAEVLRFRDNAFRIYFTNPVYLDMIARKWGLVTEQEVIAMTRYKLPRRLLDQPVDAIPA